MTVVILAEKPDQAKEYANVFQNTSLKKGYITVNDNRFFQSEAVITWCIGHMIEMCLPGHYKKEWEKWNLESLPILPDKIEYRVSKSKQTQYNIVKKWLLQASEIVIATDIEREGENIARSTMNHINVSSKIPVKRLWVNSLEPEVLQKGFRELKNGDDYISRYEEARSRQIGDWLVGMNASPLYSLLLQKQGIKETFSVGRVQTPTLYLIYQRQQEIENFKSEPFYELYASISTPEGQFKAKYKERFKDKNKLQELINQNDLSLQKQGTIASLNKELKETQSPQLHSLSSLQSTANKKWKYSPARVLEIMQKLYEKKLLTYPRTDCNHITEAEFAYLRDQLDSYKEIVGIDFKIDSLKPKKRYVDGSKVTEHYAIIPTKTIPSAKKLEQLSTEERNIHQEITRTTIAMFAPTYKHEETNVTVDIKTVLFKATGKIEKEIGWKVLFENDSKNEKKEKTLLPPLTKGQEVHAKIEQKEGKTKPPSYYTEGELIPMMITAGKFVDDQDSKEILKEKEGIGTEATRANVIETLKDRQYIQIKNNKAYVTPKGKILCDSVEGNLLSKAEMTAQWEIFLKQIGKGEKSGEVFLGNIKKFVQKLINDAPEALASDQIASAIEDSKTADNIASCPICKEGYFQDKGKLYGCSNYSNGCKALLPKKWSGKTITVSNVKTLLSKGETKQLKGFKKKDKKGTFDAKLKADFIKESKTIKLSFVFGK